MRLNPDQLEQLRMVRAAERNQVLLPWIDGGERIAKEHGIDYQTWQSIQKVRTCVKWPPDQITDLCYRHRFIQIHPAALPKSLSTILLRSMQTPPYRM